MRKKKETLIKIDRYRSFMRHKYTSLEKLKRLNIINDYYKINGTDPSKEILQSNIDFAEQLSGKLILPLKVRGAFLYEGRPYKKYYKAEELKKAALNEMNSSFPLMLDHEDKKAEKVIGKVTKVKYDDEIKGLRWRGHINDETHARNVIDGAIKEVSATIFSTNDYDEEFGLIGTDLIIKELSLVMKGAVAGNYIEVDL